MLSTKLVLIFNGVELILILLAKTEQLLSSSWLLNMKRLVTLK